MLARDQNDWIVEWSNKDSVKLNRFMRIQVYVGEDDNGAWIETGLDTRSVGGIATTSGVYLYPGMLARFTC